MSSFSDEELEREVSNEDQNEYYTLLNVPRDASPEEIRSAYRRLCRIYHPDRYVNTCQILCFLFSHSLDIKMNQSKRQPAISSKGFKKLTTF